jgi:hypothetical protein
MSHRFNIFEPSWHCTNLTLVTIQMTRGSPYIIWPNDRLTHGSTDKISCTTCDVAGDCEIRMTRGMYGDDVAGMTV